jgi:DME family drug/metabolite transporter
MRATPRGTQLVTERARGILAAAVAATLFGSAFVATAFQLRGFTPLGAALWRSALAVVLLVVLSGWLARRRGGSPTQVLTVPLRDRLWRLTVLGTLGGLVLIIGVNVAVSRIGATITGFLAGLAAVLAALFAPLVLAERLQRQAVAGFAVALTGTALLANLAPSSSGLEGLAAGCGAATSYGLFMVLVRRWSRVVQVGPETISLALAGVSTIGLVIVVAVSDPGGALPQSPTPTVAVATVWVIFVAAIGPLLIAAALHRVEASMVAPLLLLNPVTATILAAILLGERPTPSQFLGGVLVLVGMAAATDVIGVLRRRRDVARLRGQDRLSESHSATTSSPEGCLNCR